MGILDENHDADEILRDLDSVPDEEEATDSDVEELDFRYSHGDVEYDEEGTEY